MYPGSLHNHTDMSNIRGRDSINRVDELMDYAIKLGHEVIAYTEHECLSNSIKIQEKYEKVKKEHPNFKVIFGNEIYLTRNGLNADNFIPGEDKYYHFILLAKDAEGHKQLRELSTRAWMRSYMARGLRRVPTYYQDLIDIIGSNPGHVIGSTACIGGYCGSQLIKYMETKNPEYSKSVSSWCSKIQSIFGKENFFLELQPGDNKEQEFVNRGLLALAEQKGYPYIITTDSHYLKEEDREAHKVYLRSQNIEREVDDFYSTCFMMDTDKLESYLTYMSQEQLEYAYTNILKIKSMCSDFDLKRPLKIPQLRWKKPTLQNIPEKYFNLIPNIKLFTESDFCGDDVLVKLIIERIEKDETLQNQETYNEVNDELQTVWTSSNVNKAHWSSYFLNLQEIIDTCWEAGSIVLPGRGSGVGFLLLYILDITQINPLRENTKTFAWRFLNPDRVSVLDVDFDISGLRRGQVLQAFRDKYGEDRVSNVITFAVEKSKSAILTAARGLQIDNDTAQYIASLVPSDRGLIRSLSQCYYGDEENGFAPVAQFVKEMKQYPKLWEVAQKIEGIICRCGIHAGGVVFVDEPFENSCGLMRAPDGTIVTAYDLHDAEKASLIKYDALSVEGADRIQICLDLLLQYGLIEDKGSLKETYNNVIGVYNLERSDPKMWEMVWNHQIQSLFQMEKQSGIQGIAATKPKSVDDLATLNSVIRLMAQEKGGELPLEKYARFKNDISLWYKEMEEYGLTKEEQDILKDVLGLSYGICESQERFMTLVQLPECGGHNLIWADRLRKAIAKKKPEEYMALTKEFFDTVEEQKLSKNFCNYVWNVLVATSRGYGFNLSHTLAYSIIALQEMNLAYKFPIIYWNCANLIVDSGGEEEMDSSKNKNYGKIAKAINKMKEEGNIKISLVDINKSLFTFSPDEESNSIFYGLKALPGLNNELIDEIISNRPYNSLADFMNKVECNKTVMLSLIKSGAFDSFKSRKENMQEYVTLRSNPKSRLTMQNFNMLMEKGLIPAQLDFEKRLFVFNKSLKKNCKNKEHSGYLKIEKNYYDFYEKFFDTDLLTPLDNILCISESTWKKIYDKNIAPAKTYITQHKSQLLEELNSTLFNECWKECASGDYSSWEMETLGFYYHEHELKEIKNSLYGIENFELLPENPIVDYVFKRAGREIPIFKTCRIAGTVLAKDDLKSTITILTCNGVVDVKFNKDYYAKYNAQLSKVSADGHKTVVERSWFKRGTLVIVNGFRRGNMFISKTYKKVNSHQLYKITSIHKDGSIEMTNARYGEEE